MGQSLLASLPQHSRGPPIDLGSDSHLVGPDILGLANDIQNILGDALSEAKKMSTLKTPTPLSKGTLLRHLWPKQVRQDISCIRRRAKAIRRLLRSETHHPEVPQGEPPPVDSCKDLWARVGTPHSLRTALSPPPRHLDTRGVLVRPNSLTGSTTPL